MAIEIVNAEGAPAPKDGTVFNAQYSDGVAKVRWSKTRGDWETALSDGGPQDRGVTPCPRMKMIRIS
jgi:hypothetical protein